MNVRSPAFSAAALVAVLTSIAGCGDAGDPTPHSDVTRSGATIRLVDRNQADLVLYVSNQSFDDDEVRITVRIDGETVVDGDFHVGSQHNWVSFPLAMPHGEHEITAETDSGAELEERFSTPRSGTRYAVIDHWNEGGDDPDLEWLFQKQAMAFA